MSGRRDQTPGLRRAGIADTAFGGGREAQQQIEGHHSDENPRSALLHGREDAEDEGRDAKTKSNHAVISLMECASARSVKVSAVEMMPSGNDHFLSRLAGR
jgi:hypothetical protein